MNLNNANLPKIYIFDHHGRVLTLRCFRRVPYKIHLLYYFMILVGGKASLASVEQLLYIFLFCSINLNQLTLTKRVNIFLQ